METFVEIINSPSEIDNDKLINFKNQLEETLNSYEPISGLSPLQLGIAVAFNMKLSRNIEGSIYIRFDNEAVNTTLYIVNKPYLSDPQDTKDKIFRVKLDSILKSTGTLGIENSQINILLLYNQEKEAIQKYFLSKNNLEVTEPSINYLPRTPRYTLNRVVLNENLLTEIRKTISILKNRKIIYEDWGFNEIDPEPRAILNFYGPSGTGKTMTAHAISAEMNSKILALKYSEIESKYVGDAPKNLSRAFEIAQQESAILFFDEADSFLGKRITDVSSSSDQAVNSLRSQMLILLEDFEGIVIFATNLISNYDSAFESRIFKHLKFELPDTINRKKIILKTIPSKVPFENNLSLTDSEIDDLVVLSNGFSGREIKNAVLDALSTAISKNRKAVNFNDFYEAFLMLKEDKLDRNKNSTDSKNFIKISSEMKKEIEDKIQQEISSESTENASS